MLRTAFIVAASCALAAQTPPGDAEENDARLERMTTGLLHPAALAWLPAGILLVAETPAGHLRSIGAQGMAKVHDGLYASGVAADAEGRVWIADSRKHRLLRIDRRGKTDVQVEGFEGKPFNGPGAVVVSRTGHVFVADPAWASGDESKAHPFYGVYLVSARGQVSLAAKLTARPAGLAASPDGKTLYASVADTRSVLAWSIRDGELSNQRVFASGLDGVPAGLTAGPDGTVYVGARKNLLVFRPDGTQASAIALPERATDCEVGEDGSTLFIATEASLFRWRVKASDGGKGH
ncbi:MAG TPA: SMP-30/gluconolactonase/LRE family protein [Bryobacteraceae bacterium]|nr:SMP-30/gluconolactonase/LRE family protein [Bryobacteraceae bacterium]